MGPHGTTQLRVQALDLVGGVDDPAYLQGKGKERRDLFPMASPGACDRRIARPQGAPVEFL